MPVVVRDGCPPHACAVSGFLRHQIPFDHVRSVPAVKAEFYAFSSVTVVLLRPVPVVSYVAVIGTDSKQPAKLRHGRKIGCRIVIQDTAHGSVRKHTVGGQTEHTVGSSVGRRAAAPAQGDPVTQNRKIFLPGDLDILFCLTDLRIAVLRIYTDVKHPALRIEYFLVFTGKFPDSQTRRHMVAVVIADRSSPEVGTRNLFDQFPAGITVGNQAALHCREQDFKMPAPHTEIDGSFHHFQFPGSCTGFLTASRCRDHTLPEGSLIASLRPEGVFLQPERYRHGLLPGSSFQRFQDPARKRVCLRSERLHSCLERGSRDQVSILVYQDFAVAGAGVYKQILVRHLHAFSCHLCLDGAVIIPDLLDLPVGPSHRIDDPVAGEIIVCRPLCAVTAVCKEFLAIAVLPKYRLIHKVPDKSALVAGVPL